MLSQAVDNPRQSTSRQIFGLDLIRFAAASMVMFYHFGLVGWVSGQTTVRYPQLGTYAWPGWIGVEIFFVLSGFIISFSAKKATPAAFAKSRFIRLYPAAWACSTITALVLVASHVSPVGLNIIHVWLNTNLLFTSGPYLDYSYWTLQVELSFYVVVLALLYFGRYQSLPTVMSIIGLVSTGCLVLYAIVHFGWVHLSAGITSSLLSLVDTPVSRILLLDNGCFFAVGSLLYICLLERATPARLLVCGISGLGGALEIYMHAARLSEFLHTNYGWAWPMLIWIASLAALFFSVRFNSAIQSILGSQGTAAARLLGLMTYPLYLLHQRVGYVFLSVVHRVMTDVPTLLTCMGLFFVLSYLVHRYLELPLQHVLRAVLPRERAVEAPATTLP